ncbi:protein ripply2 isoform X1 [Neopsephotus bourkii]|uniref:protein ripply2 isoform X1 n=1 Tax=Neopsephotus bourkii TaxID=309878 RepID=UPI002AA588B2|nr:protein ripply2 isoform X1 [Neopsephotus bourkii]
MSWGRWAPPPAIKPSRPGANRARRAAMHGQRMGAGCGTGCACICPSPAALSPQGCSPLAASALCRARTSSALTILPLSRSSTPFWRPWVAAPGEAVRRSGTDTDSAAPHRLCGLAEASRKLAQYTHPVRLFWPKSRCYDYLYQEAEALLKNFPVQATISFYEDSDSEDDEQEQDSRTASDC